MGEEKEGVDHAARARRRVVVLGSTGSVGTNCLDVVDHLENRLDPSGYVRNLGLIRSGGRPVSVASLG